uniref:integrin alpha-D-like isoform X1 n=1 Tax=Ciona intestinalis TaxID=7719 RepID=UPI000EF49C45|nr:integrin alpha-D-like isoform X1 [Ciona intestinalis]XP_026694489.1 integrin alpha-D-like isoform X1 [Ciona intestinalis]|eukprot:XP_026694488.1 integrin alpha-D-like isoform X1 [Ciona intestinalis]
MESTFLNVFIISIISTTSAFNIIPSELTKSVTLNASVVNSTGPTYFGTSFFLNPSSGNHQLLVGSPLLNSGSQTEPSGGLSFCEFSFTDSVPSCKPISPSTPALVAGDAVGLSFAAQADGNITACAPLRPSYCDGELEHLGYCYAGTEFGKTWMSISRIDPFECPKVDILFLLDGSGSIVESDFEIMKEWIENITLSFDISSNGSVAVGLMQFSHFSLTKTEFQIGMFTTKEEIMAAMKNVTIKKGNTYTADALRRSIAVFQKSSRYNDTNTRKVIVLLTDGEATDTASLSSTADLVRSQGITITAVLITEKVLPSERSAAVAQMQLIVNGVAGNPSGVFVVGTTANLDSVIRAITQRIQSTLEGGSGNAQSNSGVRYSETGFSAVNSQKTMELLATCCYGLMNSCYI